MSKTKPSGALHYEILFIIPNKFTEEEAKTKIAEVEKLITDLGGQVSYNEYWGKKKLAYPIKHNTYGYYNLFEFDLERDCLIKVDGKLRLSNDILRFLISKKKVKTEAEKAKADKIKAKIESKKIKTEKAAEEKAAKKEAAKSSTKNDKEAGKSDLKSLDEKLEGILNAKDLL